MVDDEGFEKMIKAIAAQGYDLERAAEFAALVGDTPRLDPESDNWLVMDGDEVVARIKPLW